MEFWLNQIKNSKKTAVIHGGLLKVHYQLDEKNEMVEEYDKESYILTRRAFRRCTELKGRSEWDIEVGTADPEYQENLQTIGIKEGTNQPFVTRTNAKYYIEWRIRNLPYPIETYLVTANPDKKYITIRTTNKKYFKHLNVPDLERIDVAIEQNKIAFTHKFNTLTITYKKPKQLLDFEKTIIEEIKKVPTEKEEMPGNCKPS